MNRALDRAEELEKEKATRKEKQAVRVSTTDPDARVMKMGDGGFRPAYNVQLSSDTESQAVIGVAVSTAGNDQSELVCVTGGFRRVFVRGKGNVAKRLQIHVAAATLGIVLRKLFGVGAPRGLQGRLAALVTLFAALILAFRRFWEPQHPLRRRPVAERPVLDGYFPILLAVVHSDPLARLSTGC